MNDLPTPAAWAVMVLMPLFFSTNLIFGRWTVPEVAPFTLAFLRWGAVALVLLPFSLAHVRSAVESVWRISLLAFLGMWVCGAVVYLALSVTTATNATLIYTTSPVFVLLIEWYGGRKLGALRVLGCIVAIVGVCVILFEGEIARLLSLRLNWGDLAILACAVAWAVYSIVFRDPTLGRLPATAIFGLISGAGALLLAPFALYEFAADADMPNTTRAWMGILGIVLCSSLIAFGGYQFGLRRFGPAVTSVFMYLLPVYGVLLATTLLDEAFRTHHAAGIALVLGGVILATRPRKAPDISTGSA